MEVKYDFEQMQLSGEGLMASGQAILESDREDDSEFFVSAIVLDGGQRLMFPSRVNTGNVFNDTLFKAIAGQIEDERTTYGEKAALEWADHVSGSVKSYTSALRPHIPHNSKARLEYRDLGERA